MEGCIYCKTEQGFYVWNHYRFIINIVFLLNADFYGFGVLPHVLPNFTKPSGELPWAILTVNNTLKFSKSTYVAAYPCVRRFQLNHVNCLVTRCKNRVEVWWPLCILSKARVVTRFFFFQPKIFAQNVYVTMDEDGLVHWPDTIMWATLQDACVQWRKSQLSNERSDSC